MIPGSNPLTDVALGASPVTLDGAPAATPRPLAPTPGNFVLPSLPSFAGQQMPAALFNSIIRNSGTRLAWMKSHVCPCTMFGDTPGSPNPACLTCHGRGRYWDYPTGPFVLLRTFMHSTEAADEPGASMDSRFGQQMLAEPTITIPSDLHPIWEEASEFDAYVEVDSFIRFETAFVVGGNSVLPYQQGLSVETVIPYDSVNQMVLPPMVQNPVVGQPGYTITNGLILVTGFPEGTAYSVAYKANPVWIAWRRAGANPHTRPFGGGTDLLPVRFRGQLLDMWLRARNPFGQSTSPNVI